MLLALEQAVMVCAARSSEAVISSIGLPGQDPTSKNLCIAVRQLPAVAALPGESWSGSSAHAVEARPCVVQRKAWQDRVTMAQP